MLAKTEPLNVKVLPEHKRALQAMAKTDGAPVSVVLRRLIRREALKRGVWPVEPADNRSGRGGTNGN